MERTVNTKFYTFMQNNSGGNFDINENVTEIVIIEALNYKDANNRAENIGIYFNGVSKGYDCGCCGDRWNEQWDEYGEEEPMIYGVPAEEYIFENRNNYFNKSCIIYFFDGTKKKIGI